MSARSALRSPGPPPLSPPPPIPSAKAPDDAFRVSTRTVPSLEKSLPEQPLPRSRRRPGAQWPARPKSQEFNDAAVWPVRAPPKPQPAPSPSPFPSPTDPASASAPTRRSTISRPTDASKQPEDPSPLPPASKPVRQPSSAPPSRNNTARARVHDNKASTPGSRAVQRRMSGVERRVSGSRNQGSTPSRTPPRSPTAPAHLVEDPFDPNSHAQAQSQANGPALQKKRSFFRRVADRLTRSRSSLRDDSKVRRASVQSDAVIREMPPIPLGLVTLPNDAPDLEENDPSNSALPPTPTSTHTRKNRHRPPSIKVNESEDRRERRRGGGAMSPTNVSLPPSPGPEAILAVMSKLSSASLRQPPSPVASTQQPLPPVFSTQQPPSPVTSTPPPLSPVISIQKPPSPVTSTRPPLSPANSTRQTPSPVSSQPMSPVPLTRKPPPLVTTRQPTPTSPRHPTSPAPRYPSPSSSVATRALLPSPSGLHFPLPPQATPARPAEAHIGRDARARDGDGARDQIREREDVALPPTSKEYLPGTVESNESEDDNDEEEEERRASELKVSQWLTIPESPTTSSSLDHSLSLSNSNSQSSHSYAGATRAASGRRFGGAFRGIDEECGFGPEGMGLWRGAVMADEDGDVLPEVERMALEAEERARARGEEVGNETAGGRENGKSSKKAGRQLSLFGRRKKKGEEAAAPDARPRARPRAATVAGLESASNRRSLSFLPFKGPPASPPTLAPPTTDEPVATPRPRRQPVSPRMHTHGSILLETKDIEDPEVRRLSEMVFLT